MTTAYHISVILPLALRSTFTYKVPEHLISDLEIGKRVVVPFGQRRYYTALIYKLDVDKHRGTNAKEIAYVMDELPVVSTAQLKFWEWISYYYMSGLGAVMNVALPNALKISSQTIVSLNPEYDGDLDYTDEERMVIAHLVGVDSVEIKQIEALSAKRSVQKAINALLKRGVIITEEEMKGQPKPKTVQKVQLADEHRSEQKINALLSGLDNAPKQFEIVMRFLEITGGRFDDEVSKPLLMQRSNATSAVLGALVTKGVFEIFDAIVHDELTGETKEVVLNVEQKEALDLIHEQFKSKGTVLLQGVTGSGKTLVYAELIKQTLMENKQVLYLVPEIALTTQLVERMKQLVDCEVQVFHSRFTDRERLTTWIRLLESGGAEFVIGARSALFLPFNSLGLVIVDEEHEMSFKQHEASPHYSARDAAMVLATQCDARVLLGSATPSIESVYNAKTGKYGFAAIKRRYADIQLPAIHVIDMGQSKRADVMNASFSSELVEAIRAAMAHRQQVILFQNRRGYAPFLLCESCGWSAECNNCDVNLTFHKHFEKMLCHYCGFNYKMPKNCPQCGSAKLKVKGAGTEKLEDELELIFPEARIGRMDLDTTRKKNAFQNIITAFDEGSIDILVGTQMVTKGLDFQNVGLVGVLNADSLWNRPDFRAFERSFQLLTQVSGRAGRKGKRGKVMIQTYRPQHPVLEFVVNHDYEGLYKHQLAERQQFDYPPFTRMVQFKLMHPDAALTRDAANFFALHLRKTFGTAVLGPEEPPIPRIRGKYIRQLYLKLDMGSSIRHTRTTIWQCIDYLEGHENYRKARLDIDVDPQ